MVPESSIQVQTSSERESDGGAKSTQSGKYLILVIKFVVKCFFERVISCCVLYCKSMGVIRPLKVVMDVNLQR